MKKEEQKQHLIDMMKDDENLGLYKEEKKETTLEEAAENHINNDLDLYESLFDGHISYDIGIYLLNNLFINGAKWKEERMYTEEDMEEAFENGLKRSFDSDFDRWFEQFKKK
jgi:hypothetical protein